VAEYFCLTPKTKKKMAKTIFTFVKTKISTGADSGLPIYLCVAGIPGEVTAELNGQEVSAEPGVSFILDDKLQTKAGRDLLQSYGTGETRERLVDDVTIFARGARNTFTVDLDYAVDVDSGKEVAKEDSRSPNGFRIYTNLTFEAEDKVFDGLQDALLSFKKEMANA